METAQEPRRSQVSAAVTAGEKRAIELAVEVDKLGSVSEALRSQTITDLIERGDQLVERLRAMPAPAEEGVA